MPSKPRKILNKNRRDGELTPAQHRFLAALRGVYPRWTTAAAQVIGVQTKRISNWRERYPAFAKAMDALRKELVEEAAKAEFLAREAELRSSDRAALDAALGTYIDTWRRTMDRLTALKAAGMTWPDVEEARKTNEAFRRECERHEQEIEIGLEDARLRKAMEGEPTSLNAIRRDRPATGKPATAAAAPNRAERLQRLRQEKGAVN